MPSPPQILHLHRVPDGALIEVNVKDILSFRTHTRSRDNGAPRTVIALFSGRVTVQESVQEIWQAWIG